MEGEACCDGHMGALTDHRRRASFEGRIRIFSHTPDYTEDAHGNKRSRQHQEELPFGFPFSIVESRLCWSESKAKAKLPPPSSLKRAVYGPHRRTTSQKTRVSTGSDLYKQPEQEWTMRERCYDNSNLKSLESYKMRIAALQTGFAYASRNHHDIDCARITIQDEGVAIDTDRGGIAIEDKRVDIDNYSGGIETEGEGIAIDSGRPSFAPVVINVEMNSERESEREEGKPPEEVEPLYKRMHRELTEREFKLKVLQLEIDLAIAKFELLQFTKPKLKEKQDENESLLEREKQVIVPMEVSEGKSLRLLRDGHPWQHNQPNLSILMKAHEALQKEFTEKSEKGKKDQGTKGPKLHTNEDHVIEEVQSNDEMIAVEALMSWRSCETGSGSRKS